MQHRFDQKRKKKKEEIGREREVEERGKERRRRRKETKRENEKGRERKKRRKKKEKERKRATLLRGKLDLTHYMCKYRISGALQYTCLVCELKCVYLHLVKVEPSISILSISRPPP